MVDCQLPHHQVHCDADGPDQDIERGLATLHNARLDDSCMTESAASQSLCLALTVTETQGICVQVQGDIAKA